MKKKTIPKAIPKAIPKDICDPNGIEDILIREAMQEVGLSMRSYFDYLRKELDAEDPHYVANKTGKQTVYRVAYTTPNWKAKQVARQDFRGHLGITPVDQHEFNVNQPVVVQLIEQPGCPEVPRKGRNGTDAAIT